MISINRSNGGQLLADADTVQPARFSQPEEPVFSAIGGVPHGKAGGPCFKPEGGTPDNNRMTESGGRDERS